MGYLADNWPHIAAQPHRLDCCSGRLFARTHFDGVPPGEWVEIARVSRNGFEPNLDSEGQWTGLGIGAELSADSNNGLEFSMRGHKIAGTLHYYDAGDPGITGTINFTYSDGWSHMLPVLGPVFSTYVSHFAPFRG